MRFLCLIVLVMLNGCIHNSDIQEKPLFPMKKPVLQKKSPPHDINDPDYNPEDEESTAIPNGRADYEEFSIEPDGSVTFNADIVYFAFDTNTLTTGAMAQLQGLAKYLNKFPNISMGINGHADERGSTEYNLALGLQRSAAVKKYLELLGVNTQRLTIVSYGEELPVAEGHSESAWAQNRRVDFKIQSH